MGHTYKPWDIILLKQDGSGWDLENPKKVAASYKIGDHSEEVPYEEVLARLLNRGSSRVVRGM